MPAGLQVFNDWGTVQLTDTYQGAYLRQKGSGTLSTSPVLPYTAWTGTLTVSANDPILLFGAGAQIGILKRINNNNGTWTFTFFSTNQVSYTYYIFDTGVNPAASNFGLQVFNAAGQRMYDAATNLLRLVSIQQVTDTSNPQNFSYSAPGRTIACAVSYARQINTYTGPQAGWPNGQIRIFCDTLTFDGTTAQLGAIQYWLAPNPSGMSGVSYPTVPAPPQVLFADVTGY